MTTNTTNRKGLIGILMTAILFSTNYSFAQGLNPISIAAQPQILSELGEPLNNSIDADEMYQGDWFYLDVEGTQVVKEVYRDHQLLQTFIWIQSSWELAIEDFNTQDIIEHDMRSRLFQEGCGLNGNQQILIVLDSNGNGLEVYGLGQWGKSEIQTCKALIEEWLQQGVITNANFLLL